MSTAQHQRGPDHERERQRDLDHDETGAKPKAKSANPNRSRRVLQLGVEIRPRSSNKACYSQSSRHPDTVSALAHELQHA